MPGYRYTFDWLYLFGGVPLPVAVAAFFAIPEIITFLAGGGKISQTGTAVRGSLQGVRDALKHWFLIVRSSALGAFMGIIPDLGGSTVERAPYHPARATAKYSRQFGKGDFPVVCAPESCNKGTGKAH